MNKNKEIDLKLKAKTIKSNKIDEKFEIFECATSIYKEIEGLGFIQRLEEINQYGHKKNYSVSLSRLDYVKFQLYLLNVIRKNKTKKEYGLGGKVSFPLIKSEYKNLTITDYIQTLIIVYNIGHFYDTFTSSRAAVSFLKENSEQFKKITNLFTDEKFKKMAELIVENNNYLQFHLINSMLILEKCNQNNKYILFAKDLLYYYFFKNNYKDEKKFEKLKFTFELFKIIRDYSILVFDSQNRKIPFLIDISNKNLLNNFINELVDHYNNNQYSIDLIKNMNKIISNYLYNKNNSVIIETRTSNRILKKLNSSKNNNLDYYNDLFLNNESVLNNHSLAKQDFDVKNILKLKFNLDGSEYVKLYKKLQKIQFVRIGYLKSHDNIVIHIALRKSINRNSKLVTSLKVLKLITGFLKDKNEDNTTYINYLLSIKFFLFYLFNENNFEIKNTIDKQKCVLVNRGRKAKYRELKKIIDKTENINKDTVYESKAMLKVLSAETKNDISICIPASTIIDNLAEFDGIIIHPFRKNNQIVFIEAKNTDFHPSKGKNCLKEKLDKLKIDYKVDDIKIDDKNAIYSYTIKKYI